MQFLGSMGHGGIVSYYVNTYVILSLEETEGCDSIWPIIWSLKIAFFYVAHAFYFSYPNIRVDLDCLT